MNDLIINTTAYYIITVISYLLAVIFFMLLVSSKVKKIVFANFGKIAKSITDLKFYPTLRSKIQSFFTEPMKKAMAFLFGFISNVSVYFKKAEEFFTGKILPTIVEPVNIASLLLRKAYTDSQTAVISVVAALIVAFYFILTIF